MLRIIYNNINFVLATFGLRLKWDYYYLELQTCRPRTKLVLFIYLYILAIFIKTDVASRFLSAIPSYWSSAPPATLSQPLHPRFHISNFVSFVLGGFTTILFLAIHRRCMVSIVFITALSTLMPLMIFSFLI